MNRPLDQVDKSVIVALKENKVSEMKTLDYKLKIHGNKDDEKKEFLFDVSSFANASGGDIIFGVREEGGFPVEFSGIELGNLDDIKLRFENMIMSCTSPRISGIQFKKIDGFRNNSVLILRIPKSWNSPHMVSYQNTKRFYSRNSTGKYELDVTQLRNAFAESEELPAKIERFIDGRLGKIIAGETPMQLTEGPKAALYVLPFSSFGRHSSIPVSEMKPLSNFLKTMYGSYSYNVNVDGLVSFSPLKHSYCQMFRSGQIESVVRLKEKNNGEKEIHFIGLGRILIDVLPDYWTALKKLNVPPPFLVKMLVIGAKGYTQPSDFFMGNTYDPIDRDIVHLPEALVENYDMDVHDLIKPILDGVWNACGVEKCNLYDSNGRWKNPVP